MVEDTKTATSVWDEIMSRMESTAKTNSYVGEQFKKIQAMHFDLEKIERTIATKFRVVERGNGLSARRNNVMVGLAWKNRGDDRAEVTLDFWPGGLALWVYWEIKGGPISLKWQDTIESVSYHPEYVEFRAEPSCRDVRHERARFSLFVSPGYHKARFEYPYVLGVASFLEVPVWPIEPRIN